MFRYQVTKLPKCSKNIKTCQALFLYFEKVTSKLRGRLRQIYVAFTEPELYQDEKGSKIHENIIYTFLNGVYFF